MQKCIGPRFWYQTANSWMIKDMRGTTAIKCLLVWQGYVLIVLKLLVKP